MRTDKRAGITIDDRGWVTCQHCGQGWSPNIQHGGGYHRGWRRCPNDCNVNQLGNGRAVAALVTEHDEAVAS